MKWLIGLMAGFIVAAGAQAQTAATPPDVMVKNVTDEVLTIVRTDKDIKKGNTQRAISLVEAKVLPHFDFARMTALAMGRDWRKATPEQQKTLTEQFKTLLVRTYSKALTEYRDQTIEYRPVKFQPADTDVTVRTLIKQAGAKPIDLNYYLEKSDAEWKVYDISVGGVSLVTNYRSEFTQAVSQDGIDGLIKRLEAKNQSGGAAKKS
jgi:phospholipid transport system substrate-binding protein